MIRLIKRKRVPYRVGHRGTRVIYEVRTDVARELHLAYQPALLCRQGSKYLGVTHSLYRDLRRNGVLKKTHETMMPTAIAVCDLDDFKQRVLAHTQKVARTDGLQSLDWFRRKKCRRNVMVQILDRILRNAVPCFYLGPVPQCISGLLVRAADVAAITAEVSPRLPPKLAELRVRYQLSVAEVHTLARYLSRVPGSIRKIPPGTVDEAKLDEFMTRYQGLDAYARRQGTRYLMALSRLRQAKAELLKIPVSRNPGRFVYFVPRRECRRTS